MKIGHKAAGVPDSPPNVVRSSNSPLIRLNSSNQLYVSHAFAVVANLINRSHVNTVEVAFQSTQFHSVKWEQEQKVNIFYCMNTIFFSSLS